MEAATAMLQDLLGPAAYKEWFGGVSELGTASGNEPTTNATKGGAETMEGGAEVVVAEAKVGKDGDADDLDQLLLQASQMVELELNLVKPQDLPTVRREEARFARPKTDAEVLQMRATAVPDKTRQDTAYCVRVWDAWSASRSDNSEAERTIPPLLQLTTEELQFWLTRFVLEARKKDGSEYPPNSLHHLVCGLMRHIRQNGRPSTDFFKDPDFAYFRQTLDAEMKRLTAAGLASKPRQAEPLTEADEEKLWDAKVLGDHSPQALLNTVIYMNGVYFALRSGAEHRQLRHNPCQIQVVENPGERPYLQYSEDVSKNNPGGLKSRKIRPKVVQHHGNPENPDRCFVRLLKLYNSLCPPNRPDHAFYLTPLTKPKDGCWYSRAPLGHNKLRNAVADMCKQARIPGYHTNHSLRATAATRLYRAGVDEQMVMERTGHRSLEGVRSYKRTSNEQRAALSDVLNCKKPRHDFSGCDGAVPTQQVAHTTQSVSMNDTFQYSSKDAHAFTFNLHSCGTVNVNFNGQQ